MVNTALRTAGDMLFRGGNERPIAENKSWIGLLEGYCTCGRFVHRGYLGEQTIFLEANFSRLGLLFLLNTIGAHLLDDDEVQADQENKWNEGLGNGHNLEIEEMVQCTLLGPFSEIAGLEEFWKQW